ncbi:MAG: proton-conducting transporter membrane subunit [Planctomycetota bacterium]
MPNTLVILPILLPLMAAVVNLLIHHRRWVQAGVGLAGLTLTLLSSIWLLATALGGTGVVVSQMGNWPAPFGISVVADLFGGTLVCVASAVSLAVYGYALSQTPTRFTGGYFNVLFPLLVCGVNWAFLTGDLFNLFVSFEVMLLASYCLLTIGTTPRQMRQAFKYVLLNLVVSAVFVAGCGWVYGTLGTLNFAEMAVLARQGHVSESAAMAVAALAFVFAAKAAAFPLWFWLPDTYPTLPPAIGGFYAGLLTKVGVYALVRVVVMCFGPAEEVQATLTPLIMISAAGTMFLGVLGAVGSSSVRRILSIHVISQVGYMILGIALALAAGMTEGGELAMAATLLYMVQHMIVKCSLFLCGGLIEKYGGTDELSGVGSLLTRDRWLATVFLIAALSLVGLPPLSGFFGKYLLILASFQRFDSWGVFLGIVAVATGALTLLSMAKIWSYAFWSPAPEGSLSQTLPPEFRPPQRKIALVATTSLVLLALTVGLFAHVYFELASKAGKGIIHPDAYVTAVLGDRVASTMVPANQEETP